MLDEAPMEDIEFTIADKKRAAFEIVVDAMADAQAEGIERDIVSQATLFAALTDLVACYGEKAVADLTVKLADKVIAGEYTIGRTLQ